MTILLLEPNPDYRQIYGALLRARGFEVLESATSAEAMRLAREAHPVAAVVSLREKEGWEYLEAPPEEGGRSIPAVALTWDENTHERARVLRRPRTLYAARPTTLERFLALVDAASHLE